MKLPQTFISDDPIRDAERYMDYLDERMARFPVCDCCKKHITDNEALHYVTRKHEFWICLECIDENMELIEDDYE